MFVLQASQLLRNIICPLCRNGVHIKNGSPFRIFNALELNDECPNKDCKLFYETLNTHFKSFETGQINESELKSWLDNFRAENQPQ